ncbi:MAG TPA: Tim44-like domain-containing protein [Solirubrobacteraceae bacterium]|nr:Tim44-like domain-containing protein [Solirubrobacteraceae bacterium]
MRRRLLILGLVGALALILAPEALAAAGGGASGFGGGGGGEGGGGRGAGLYILIQILIRVAILGHGLGALVLIGLIILAVLFLRVVPGARTFWSARQDTGSAARRQVARRQRRVELAAAEAAEDDPAFAPDAVRAAAAQLFTDIQTAWDRDDRQGLSQLVAPDLMKEWSRRLAAFQQRGWHNHVQPLEPPRVEYVSLVHRGDANDRVVVRIEGRIRDFVVDHSGRRVKRVGHATETVRIREFWTLARRRSANRPWILASIEQGGEGRHALDERILATRASDEQGMRDEALIEGAVAEAVPSGTKIAEVADLEFAGDARAAALDLSLADGRFAPDVLDVAARRAVAAWAQAIDGDDLALEALADRTAVQDLLHPGDPSGQTRLVVRGPQVTHIRIVGLDAAALPPTMTIEVDVRGRRYLEDRDTAAVVAGSRTRPTSFTERWTLGLTDDPREPWRIRSVEAPAATL